MDFYDVLNILSLILYFVVTFWSGLHVVLYKKNTRAALAWLGLIIFSPLFGPFMYYVFGINRINRKVLKLNKKESILSKGYGHDIVTDPEGLKFLKKSQRQTLFKMGENLNLSPFYRDTKIKELIGGDVAFKEMLTSMSRAEKSITLMSYIFEDDDVGAEFIKHLVEAKNRGVQVRVLVDHVGSEGAFEGVVSKMKNLGIKAEAFLPMSSLFSGPYANLRNHRKLLIIDGVTAFTGGMNISSRHTGHNEGYVRDIHFKISGSIVHPMQMVFADDWAFTTEEVLNESHWYPQFKIEGHRDCMARVVPDGPGEGSERTVWQLLHAISMASSSIQILTPYFLPPTSIMAALKSAVLRGVEVEVVTPEVMDHQLIHYAMMGSVRDLIVVGAKIFLSKPPFDHSKIFIVDKCYVNIGSSNWDSRSLLLNFELNIECLCPDLANKMKIHFEGLRGQSRLITYEQYNNRNAFKKLRDGLLRLLSPYL